MNLLESLQGAGPEIRYLDKKVLIADDSPSVRSTTRDMFRTLGVLPQNLKMVSGAADVIRIVKDTTFDIIVSDYNFWDGEKNGQQILEELRRRHLVTFSTVFMVSTGEKQYERVVAAAEFAPDVYLLKPFSLSTLKERLREVLHKKSAFSSAYELTAKKLHAEAIAQCDSILSAHPKYRFDALRFKAELLIEMGHFHDAEELFQQIIRESGDRIIPWARFGLVQAFHAQGKDDVAVQVLKDIIENNPQMVRSYDLLAEIQESQWENLALQETLEAGVRISPNSVPRQRKLGDVALKNGARDIAKQAYKRVVEEKRSHFFRPTDMSKLVKVHMDSGDIAAAKYIVTTEKRFLNETDEGRLVYHSNMSDVYLAEGDSASAKRHMKDALFVKERWADADIEELERMMETCKGLAMTAEASSLSREIIAKRPPVTMPAPLQSDASRRPEIPELPKEEAAIVIRRIGLEWVRLSESGDLRGAYDKFEAALELAPESLRENLNLLIILIRLLETNGIDDALVLRWRELLAKARSLNSEHEQYKRVNAAWESLERKAGLSA